MQRIPAVSLARGLLDLDGGGHVMADVGLSGRAAGGVRAWASSQIADGGRAAAEGLKASQEVLMRIVNPTFGVSAAGGEAVAVKPVDWRTDAVAMFSNSKPNARELLEGIRARLADIRSVDNIELVHKNSASQPAPAELIEAVAGKYKGALLAIAD